MKLCPLFFLSVLALLTINIAIAEKSEDDFLNPKPKTHPTPKNPVKVHIPDGKGKVKYHKPLVLSNYGVGRFFNENTIKFCKDILSQVEDVENTKLKQNKIISINIKGFADGNDNKGIRISERGSVGECAGYISENNTVNDTALAILRACNVKQVLKNGLKGKPYYIFVNLSQDFYDEPTGGKSTADDRKVEVTITYIEKSKSY